jgi:hypothetical protein
MIPCAHASYQLKAIVQYYKGAGIVGAEVVDGLGEGELPELCANELHSLQLRLEFHLHIFG